MFKDIYMDEDTTYESSDRYIPEVDQYRFASMFTFTDEESIYYAYTSNSLFLSDTFLISFTADSLYLIPDLIGFAYYFSNDNELVLRQEYNWSDTSGERTHISEIYFQKFKGEIPPDSWYDPIEEDKYEPDNSIASATNIYLGKIQSHSFTENDTDYCSFNAIKGQGYLIQGLSYIEIESALLDNEGNILLTDSDNDLHIAGLGDEVETLIAWECNASGKYYVMLRDEKSHGLFSSGFYQVRIDKCNIEDLEYGEECQVYGKKVFEFGSKFFIKLQTK
jgi:hypothetical protein